jgi:hypothetical protein
MSKIIHFSFTGKDSVKDERDLEISDEVYLLLQKFTQNKKSTDPIFSHADSGTVNMLLKTIMPDITVKNLRTVKANQEFIDAAKEILAKSNPKTEIEKIRILFLANKAVAEKLNHQKNVAKNFKESTGKLKEKIQLTETKAKETALKIKENKIKLDIQEAEARSLLKGQPQTLKLKLEEIKLKRQKLIDRETRTKVSIEKAKFSYEKKSGSKEIALGTSLGAYLDPRIVFSLCKEINLDAGKIYTKKQLEMFDVFANTDSKFWRSL